MNYCFRTPGARGAGRLRCRRHERLRGRGHRLEHPTLRHRGRRRPMPMARTMVTVQTAAHVATNAITRRYPAGSYAIDVLTGASIDAAVAAANRAVTAKMAAPCCRQSTAPTAALGHTDGLAKTAGIDVASAPLPR